MVAALEFPPSARDFDVYRRAVVFGLSTRQVAGEFSISQTRVRQLVERVGRWLTEVLPNDEVAEENALRLARQLAADRLEFFYSQVMHGWHNSNNPRALSLAIRIVAAQSKLPVLSGRIEAIAADVTEGPLPDCGPEYPHRGSRAPTGHHEVVGVDRRAENRPTKKSRATSQTETGDAVHATPSPVESHPVGHCSPPVQNNPSAANPPADNSTITPHDTKPIGALSPQAQAARSAFFGTAQAPFRDLEAAPSEAITELKVTPEQLGLSVEEVLARRERRERRRAKAGR